MILFCLMRVVIFLEFLKYGICVESFIVSFLNCDVNFINIF